jgi:hypothetical protein
MSMTYKQIQDAVLSDSFPEGRRVDAKTWIQFRHSWLWDLEEWTFKYGTGAVTFTAGSQVAAAPADLQTVLALYNAMGLPVRGVRDPREFFDTTNPQLGGAGGAPIFYTVVGGQLLVGSAGDGSTGFIVYEKKKPTLFNDLDATGLPDGYDLALVHGGKAEGFKLTNVPLWQGFDDDFTAAANALRRNYLTSIREAGAQQLGAFRARQWA